MKEYSRGGSLIVTDGVFALTGEIAPVDRIYDLAIKYGAFLIIDDAHSTGILGEHGRGTPEYFGVDGANGIYQSETMSKAIGSYGGFISSDNDTISRVRQKSVIYQASTSLPPPIVASSIASLKIIMENPGIRMKLAEKARLLRNEIDSLGFHTLKGITPIIPIIEDSIESAENLSAFLEQNGIIVPVIKYPGVKSNSLLRVTVSALHEHKQIEMLVDNLHKWKNKYGKIFRPKGTHKG
ncbi:MAG: pyridoxal phosphate-dependent aminotransferase family protein [Bacteroidales bacterium]|nr:pyridoxal phosphate-dependent aminotransferase family protein [Bacteroidales bacterium]